jgi:steroid delta-isomerase-like uncharacterized protein
MSADDSKSLNRRWIQAFNERDWPAETACRTPGYRAYMSGVSEPLNADGWSAFLNGFLAAFPDAQISVNADVAQQDLVASRWTLTGTHHGEFQGVPPTGRTVRITGIDFSRIVDGKIAEHWAQFDLISVMQQIGAAPAQA